MTHSDLRPLERRVIKLAGEGMSQADIAWRFRRSPGHIQRIIDLTKIPREASSFSSQTGALRPLERCILNARENGTDTSEIAARLRRSPDFVSRVESYAKYKLAQDGD